MQKPFVSRMDSPYIWLVSESWDTIQLISLDKTNAIPVDTHVYQIAAKHYLNNLNLGSTVAKTVSTKAYLEINQFFQDL